MKVNLNRKLRKLQSEALVEFNKGYIIAVTAMTLWSVHKVLGCGKRKLRQLLRKWSGRMHGLRGVISLMPQKTRSGFTSGF